MWYALSPYITQIRFVFKGLMDTVVYPIKLESSSTMVEELKISIFVNIRWSNWVLRFVLQVLDLNTRVVPKVMSNSFLHANWEQQTKESAVVDGTSSCVILECLVRSIACITWLVSLLTKWPTTICLSPACCHRIPCERGNPCCRNSPETSSCLWKCVHGCEQCSKMGETF